MTLDELSSFLEEKANDPVFMEELMLKFEITLARAAKQEEEYRIEQRRLWDLHKHDTYY